MPQPLFFVRSTEVVPTVQRHEPRKGSRTRATTTDTWKQRLSECSPYPSQVRHLVLGFRIVALYHVRITVAGDGHGELKPDLTMEQLQEQFLEPYGSGLPITVNGRSIEPSNLERLQVSTSDVLIHDLIAHVRARRQASGVVMLGGPSDAWRAAGLAENVTDQFIKGPPGWASNSEASSAASDTGVRRVSVPSGPGDRRSVFLVQGRNTTIARAMRDFLRSLDLKVIEWEHAVGLTAEPNPYIGDIILAGMGAADGIVVLATPDDIVRLDPDLAEGTEGGELAEEKQPRQNVIYEAGMAMALAPNRTLIIATPGTKILSDIAGRHLAYLDDSPQEESGLWEGFRPLVSR